MTATNRFNTLWNLHFERDGTEDVAVICDADGDELVRSRPFWLPDPGDPSPPTLHALQLMAHAPRLLSSLERLLNQIDLDFPPEVMGAKLSATLGEARSVLDAVAGGGND
jgi:hypothetical protein